MSRRTWQPAAGGSRRSRRAEPPLPQPPTARSESPKIVSNPIFHCEAGPSQKPKPPANGDHLRCVYRPNSLYALVHDPAASAAANGNGKPLPLPPCRAHRAGQGASGSHVPAPRSGPVAVVAGGPHGRVMRRAVTRDPFLAAYVACSKSAGGGEDATGVDRPEQKQRQGRRRKKRAAKKKGKEGEEIAVRGCGGIWSSGWAAAGAKYAGAMSCRHGCAVAEQKQGDAAHAAAAKKEAGEDAAVPTLDLSWAPAVLSARASERRRQQR
ncbi:unnamed protein product [Urochloa decumbens]|uniref:Uncharacterized protein n=1 Tax=Urochloa decumbens TaxID=240449 RepID=A0ABC8YK91_9POAL